MLIIIITPPTEKRCRGGGGVGIMVGTVDKANVGELEEDIRERFSNRLRKELTGVFQGLSGKKRFCMGFQDGWENYLNSNQLTNLISEKIPIEEEHQVPTISVIPDEKVPS